MPKLMFNLVCGDIQSTNVFSNVFKKQKHCRLTKTCICRKEQFIFTPYQKCWKHILTSNTPSSRRKRGEIIMAIKDGFKIFSFTTAIISILFQTIYSYHSFVVITTLLWTWFCPRWVCKRYKLYQLHISFAILKKECTGNTQ